MAAPLTWSRLAAADRERPWEALLAAGGLGLVFQWLFWEAGLGAAFPLYVVVVLATLWMAASRQGLRPARSTGVLAAATVLVATGVAVRAEPLTTAVNVLVALGLLAVTVHAYGSDHWLRYGLRDWLLATLRLVEHEASGAPGFVQAARRTGAPEGRRLRLARLAPVLRGAGLAIPVVLLLAGLLASADMVFASRLSGLSLALPSVGEVTGRLLLAATVAYAAAGGLWHLRRRREERVLADTSVPRVLGFTEAAIVLGSVNLLFAGFVVIQVRYFFGGGAAVLANGMTFAEYARRGFGELLAVAGVSLGLHLALAGLTRRETPARRWVFTGLTAGLTGLVLVILVSAFQRLALYEQAFGFTRLRTLVHVFMVWVALVLVAVLVLELADRLRLFLLVGIAAVVGFAVTLNVVGIDPLIARHNLARATQGAEIDLDYLHQLSPDAVPVLVEALPALQPRLAAEVAGVVGCIQERSRARAGHWRSLRLSDVRARAAAAQVGDHAALKCLGAQPARRAAAGGR